MSKNIVKEKETICLNKSDALFLKTLIETDYFSKNNVFSSNSNLNRKLDELLKNGATTFYSELPENILLGLKHALSQHDCQKTFVLYGVNSDGDEFKGLVNHHNYLVVEKSYPKLSEEDLFSFGEIDLNKNEKSTTEWFILDDVNNNIKSKIEKDSTTFNALLSAIEKKDFKLFDEIKTFLKNKYIVNPSSDFKENIINLITNIKTGCTINLFHVKETDLVIDKIYCYLIRNFSYEEEPVVKNLQNLYIKNISTLARTIVDLTNNISNEEVLKLFIDLQKKLFDFHTFN